jgi:hypothetical protein
MISNAFYFHGKWKLPQVRGAWNCSIAGEPREWCIGFLVSRRGADMFDDDIQRIHSVAWIYPQVILYDRFLCSSKKGGMHIFEYAGQGVYACV